MFVAIALPFDFNECVGPDGRVNRTKVAFRALMRPSAVGDLIGLRRRVSLCADRLADFVTALLAADEQADVEATR